MQNYINHFDGAIVVLLFLVFCVFVGIVLFCANVIFPRQRYEKGQQYALEAFEKFGDEAKEGLQNHLEAPKILGCLGEFEKGIVNVLESRGLCKLREVKMQTYEEARQRGVKFASQIVRNYPETGVQTLVEAQLRHASTQVEFDAAFSDGIQEVLDQLAGVGK